MRFWRCCGNAALILIALLKERSRQVLRRRPRASPPSGFGRRLARPVRPATGTAPIREQLNRRAPAATPRHGASQSGCPWSGRSRRWCWGEQARPASGSEVSHQPAGQAAARALPSGTPDSRAAGAYAGTPSVRPGSISANAGNRRARSVGARERGAGMPRKFTAFVPRYQKFESISLQRRVVRTPVRTSKAATGRVCKVAYWAARQPARHRHCRGSRGPRRHRAAPRLRS